MQMTKKKQSLPNCVKPPVVAMWKAMGMYIAHIKVTGNSSFATQCDARIRRGPFIGRVLCDTAVEMQPRPLWYSEDAFHCASVGSSSMARTCGDPLYHARGNMHFRCRVCHQGGNRQGEHDKKQHTLTRDFYTPLFFSIYGSMPYPFHAFYFTFM